MTHYSIKELMACWLSRDLADGEFAAVGANFPVPRAAVLLAHFLHGPNMTVGMGAFRVNLENVGQVMSLKFFSDFRPVRWAESVSFFPLDLMGFHKLDAFYISGIQIDAHGNTNLIGIIGEKNQYKFRGPGSIGTTTLAAVAKRYYIVAEHHTPRLFVEQCSVKSAMGFGDGAPGLRVKLGLPGGGPRYCITPLCVFDFHPVNYRMRLHSLHPGISLQQVMDNTGFRVEMADAVMETEPPTRKELEVLRGRVDPEGRLRA
jgi:glutaconate CoA-transferase, subunit B